MALLRSKTKFSAGHGRTVDIIAPKQDSLSELTNKALVVYNTLYWKLLRGIKFRMIILVNWRGPFLRQGTKNRFALVNNPLDVHLSSPWESAIRVSEEVTSKMIGYLPNSLELVALASEFLKEKVRVGHNTRQIINIDTDKFIVCARSLHPNIRIGLTRVEIHIHKSFSKEFMPSGSTSPKSIESLDNDE
jgi:hypothetical protein